MAMKMGLRTGIWNIVVIGTSNSLGHEERSAGIAGEERSDPIQLRHDG